VNLTATSPRLRSERSLPRRALDRASDSFDRAGLPITLAWVIPFFAAPVVLLVAYSFSTQSYATAKISFGWSLDAWRGLSDPIVYRALIRSVALSTAATVGCLAIGYPLAYFIARHAGRLRSIALVMIIIPFWVSFVIRAYAWVTILGTTGPINHALLHIGLIGSPLHLEYNYTGIAIGIIYGYLPLMVFPLYVALERIDQRVIESARDLGASTFATFRRVVLPQSIPGLIAGCLLVWIPALGEYVIPTILGGGKTYMIGNVIAQYFTAAFQWPLGSALSVVVVSLALIVVAVVVRVVGPKRIDPAYYS
jgi:spermidine/putrescine transport system permease protein